MWSQSNVARDLPRHQEGIKPFAAHKLQLVVDCVLEVQLKYLPLLAVVAVRASVHDLASMDSVVPFL